MKKNTYALTLVELIVVVMILAIIWIVWFLSYKSYVVSVRDSSRMVELENVTTSLWSYVLRSWFYPEPTSWVDITYSWQLVWTQWIFWDDVANIVGYSKKPVDPLTDSFYTYSLKNTKKEYSIAWALEERPWLVTDNLYFWKTYAEAKNSKRWFALVKWNYNWEIASINLNWSTNVLALPSIITTNTAKTDLVDILSSNSLVYNDYENLPSSYSGSSFKLDANVDFSPNTIVVYSWSISNLKQAVNQILLLQNVYNSYSWNILWKKISVSRLDSSDLFSPEPSSKVKAMACDLVNFKLKYFVECWWIDFITFFVINVLHIDIASLPWTKITAVYQDSSWNFVFWTNQWLAFYDGTNWVVYDQHDSPLVHNYITSVTQDNNWDYWVWTQNGINRLVMWNYLNKADDIWFTYDKTLLDNTHIQYIYTDTNGTVWIWTNMWVTSYNWDIWTDYTQQSWDITHNNITAIYHDSQWYVWFWTNSKWVDRYRISDWNLTNFNAWYLPDQRVTYIFEDSTWKVWIGTQWWLANTTDYWVTTWNQYTNISTSGGLIADYVTYLFEDTWWNIWVWTNWWVSKFNWSTWVSYSTSNWLLWNYIFLIYQDEFWNTIIFSDWWMDTINPAWNIIT